MVLPTEITIKQEFDEIENKISHAPNDYEVQVKVEIENSQVAGDVDWCVENITKFEPGDEDQQHTDIVGYEKLVEYFVQECLRCRKIFLDSFSFLCHNLTHIELKLRPIVQLKYQCDDCLQYFKNKSALKKHILQKNLEPSGDSLKPECLLLKKSVTYHQCKYCGILMNYKNWHSHMSTVHGDGQFHCMKCSKMFKCLRYLKRHDLYVHNGGVRCKGKDPFSVQEVKCKLCPAVLAHKHALKTHMRNCHCEKVKCKMCNSELKKSYLNNHIRRVHYDDGKEYKCFCGKKFKSPRYLKIHKKNSQHNEES